MAKERISQKWNKNVKSGGTMTAPPRVESLRSTSPPKEQTSGSKAIQPGQKTVLTHERIAERAWLIWRNRGCIPGEDKRNWFESEKQLKAELGIN